MSLINSKTITQTVTLGAVTSFPTYASPLTITATGAVEVSPGDAIFGPNSNAWTVVNQGTVTAAGTGSGIDLSLGGSVINGPSGTTAALIEGSSGAININGAAGTVVNYGTIAGVPTGSFPSGVNLFDGGYVRNGASTSTGALISAYRIGVFTQTAGGAGTVLNFGTIESRGSPGNAVQLGSGGTVTNELSGLIAGLNDAVLVIGATGTVTNFGTIQSTGITAGAGVFFGQGAVLTNQTSGLITAYRDGVLISAVAGTVTNFGTIVTTDTGTLAAQAINIGAAGGTIVNYGMIDNLDTIAASPGTGGIAISLEGGLLINEAGATINGGGGNALVAGFGTAGAAVTVTNYGTIESASTVNSVLYFARGGIVTNAAAALITGPHTAIRFVNTTGTVVNSGTITGTDTSSTGVYLGAGGTVTNSGMISGAASGVDIAHTGGTVTNLGTIKGTSLSASQVTGVSLFGGSITNGAGTATSAVISGVQYGAEIGNTAGTVLNFGSIVATGTGGIGLRLVDGGAIDNLGTITGPGAGIFLNSPTSLTNGKSGTAKGYIEGQTGVNMQTPGTVINYGRIVGAAAGSGLYFSEGGTVHNFGTITAGTGVDFNFLNAGGIVVNGKSGSTAGLIIGGTTGVSIETSGGTVTNFARINGGNDGVDMFGTVAVVLNNFGTIDGGSHGAYLGGSAGAKIVNSGTINGGAEGIHTRDAPARVTNSGTGVIENSTGYVINLTAGGTVINQGQILAGNTLRAAVHISNAAGSVNNSGTIVGGAGVYLGAAGAVTNTGTIISTNTAFSIAGVHLSAGGSVSNLGTSSLIDGNSVGVYLIGGVGTVTNAGTIIGGTDKGVALYDGGRVINSGGIIEGYDKGVAIYGTVGTVINSGTITGRIDGGVALYAGGVVTNQAGGSIAGAGSAGIDITGGTGTVVNSGAIEGTGTYAAGVALLAGGSISNALGGVIEGPGGGVYIAGNAGTIVNLGTIESTDTANHSTPFRDAIYLRAGGSVINGQSGSNAGLIATGAKFGGGVDIRGTGSVTNHGTIAAAGRQSFGIFIGGSGTVSNFGTIVDTGRYNYYVVALFGGGTVANFGTIAEIPGVSNAGFDRYSDGVDSQQGGLVTNGQSGATAGLISAAHDGVYIDGGVGTVVNFGTISGTGTNGAGITLQTGGTVTDFGTVNGASGTAISFGGTSANRLILESGYHLGGKVFGSTGAGATNTLELGSAASVGTVSAALATEFVNFGTVTVELGAQWTLTGASYLGGITLTDFGTLTNTGSLGGGSIIVDPASLINSGSIGTTVTLAGGSYLDNEATGKIARAGTAVAGIGGAATVVNAGKIIGGGGSGDGVDLAAGGKVTNTTATALIAGNTYGILIGGSGGTVGNRGTVASSGGTGVSLFAGGVTNGATNATGAVISGSHFGVEIQHSAGRVVNFGSITSSADTGVWLNAGTVINGPSGATHALISGPFDGVFVAAGSGTVRNYGTVTGGGSNDGVCLFAGGRVSNGLSGALTALISGYAWGVEIQHSAGTVINFGTIESTGTAGFTSAVDLAAGGTVTDSGTIRGASGAAIVFGGTSANRVILGPGYHLGGKVIGSPSAGATNTLELGPGAGTGTVSSVIATEFVHFGAVKVDAGAHWVLTSNNTIAAGHTLTVDGALTDLGTLTNAGVITVYGRLTDLGILRNAGVITGSGQLIVDPATLINSGSIGTTVILSGGGTFDNKAGGTAIGVYGTLGAATIVNAGKIFNSVDLFAGGSVTNSGTGLITNGVGISGTAGTVANSGTIIGGINLSAGGVSNTGTGLIEGEIGVHIYGHGATVSNSATIVGTGSTGYDGINLRAGGSVRNTGTGLIEGGVYIGGTGAKVTNSATIIGTGDFGNGDGVIFSAGGSVANNAGLIEGDRAGIEIRGAGAVTNFATIIAQFLGAVLIGAGGSVRNNAGLIDGFNIGVGIGGGSGNVTNFGTIIGQHYQAVQLDAGGSVHNNAGLIEGATGVAITGGSGMVTNTGRIISSATGVLMRGAGSIDNGNRAATGATISGSAGVQIFGTGVATIVNFGTVTGTGGTAVSLGAGNDRVVIEAGSVLHGAVAGFHPGDTFDLPFMSFSSAGTVTLKSGNVLRVVENGGTFNIKLDPGQNFTGDFFHLGGDGGGGTLITENHTPPAPYSISPNPASVLDNAGHLIFTIKRSDTSGPAVVYASVIQDQGFTNNGDYTFVNDMEVNFATGVASVQVSVGIIDTGAASGSEVFRFIIQQHKTDPVSTSLASDKFTITNTTALAAAATSRFTFADIAPTGLNSGAASSGSSSNYLPGAIAANEQAHAGGQLLFATGHPGGSLLSLAGGANHHSLLPA